MKKFFRSAVSTLKRLDWRVWAILISAGATIVVTLLIYMSGFGRDPATHFGAMFASWVSGVALFSVVGIVVAIVSLAKPEQESFDARARILFRRQSGPHIDYIINRMRSIFEHYAETNVIKVTIEQYHPGEKKYFIASSDEMILRSYIDDVETTWESKVAYKEMTAPPANGPSNRLVYVRINDVQDGVPEDFTDAISRPVTTRIGRSPCKIEYCAKYWLLADTEPNEHTTARFNQALTLTFENHTKEACTIRYKTMATATAETVVPAGESRTVSRLNDIQHDKIAYEFYILAP